MSEEERGGFEIPKEMRSMAEASFDQARKAFDKFLAGAQQTAGTIEERGATDNVMPYDPPPALERMTEETGNESPQSGSFGRLSQHPC